MTPVRQTIFVADHAKARGNCMSACLASILERPLGSVIDTTSDECCIGSWWSNVSDWLASEGFRLRQVLHDDERLAGYSIGVGPSPRGAFNHAVVCKAGRMVFDPHPSDDGIVQIHEQYLLLPMTEAEIAWHRAGKCA